MEFDLIEAMRARMDVARDDVVLGIGDDAALLDLPAGQRLVACTDTLVEGVHFPRGSAPDDLGWKALAVNLSDLAAMGAEPAWALLALTLPEGDARFVERFAEGFAELARAHGVALIGGDTTQGPLSATVTALGFVPAGDALTRSAARVGDVVFVTGTLGDAAGALHLQQDRGHAPEALSARMARPEPRVAVGLVMRGLAHACIDVSDGLLADLGHVCASSGVGAVLDADALPLSPALAAAFDAQTCRDLALSGGDDYELCFSVPSVHEKAIVEAVQRAGCSVTRIGRIVAGSGVRAVDAQGNVVTPPNAGWEHFSQ
ncbi:MAG: thiamine-phosphate kinase [Rhodanobacteraceae bacterium]|nr:MAG: thiamine-phosphate kinase [Rhodanobacteraceae bacterium]